VESQQIDQKQDSNFILPTISKLKKVNSLVVEETKKPHSKIDLKAICDSDSGMHPIDFEKSTY